MVSVSLRSLGAVTLVLALGNVVFAAPTSSSTLDARSAAEIVTRTKTGYETYTEFMAESDKYHALTEGK
jgi:hypothetical protein